jgi:hypothetical protein
MSREYERKAYVGLEAINQQLETLNVKLEASNARMTTAIIILTDILEDLMPHIVTDPATLDQLKAATAAAKKAALV